METVSKFLTEAMGECWHEWPDRSTPCTKCGQRSSMSTIGMHTNFLTWEGFGKLWTWATKQDWWEGETKGKRELMDVKTGETVTLPIKTKAFLQGPWQFCGDNDNGVPQDKKYVAQRMISPENFAKAVADFLQKK